MLEKKELYDALAKLYEYAIELNQQRIKDGKKWLQDFGEVGIYHGGAFYEFTKRESYTCLHGMITEYEMFQFVAVACCHDAIENEDDTLSDEYIELIASPPGNMNPSLIVAELIAELKL